MAFFQSSPELGNQYSDDRVLRSYLRRVLTPEERSEMEPSLERMGELAGGELYRLQQADRLNEPVLTQWDPWGHRIDHIELTPLWKRAKVIACEEGVVATAYEAKHGAHSRVHQFALVYLFEWSSDVYTCPLAMTDGAAATLRFHGGPCAERAIPRLTSRDPEIAWTSGQWMTERTGGSDVGLTETTANPREDGTYELSGTKWFTSATTSEMALTLARPLGNPPGGRGLALFYVEMFDEHGDRNGISINRLKDKLGTRKVPTAELTLSAARATPVAGSDSGIRNITPMLNITRTWNAIASIGAMRRGLALARDYAKRRVQFGAALSKKPLHIDTLAGMQAEFEAAFHLAFFSVELIGKLEHGTLDDAGKRLLRLVTPLAKLTTAKQAVSVTSEAIECFGGAGYVEDTGMPRVLRDAQVLPIWEGTTNVLSLDSLRAIAKEGSLAELRAELHRLTEGLSEARQPMSRVVRDAADHAKQWLEKSFAADPLSVEAGARRVALTLGRALELALLLHHAEWAFNAEGDSLPTAAAIRFAAHGVDQIVDDLPSSDLTEQLANL